jgi:hypothetical protein
MMKNQAIPLMSLSTSVVAFRECRSTFSVFTRYNGKQEYCNNDHHKPVRHYVDVLLLFPLRKLAGMATRLL